MPFPGGVRAFRLASHAALAAAALLIWHMVLLRQDLERPWLVVLRLLVLLVVWVIAVRPARATLVAGVSFLVLLFLFHWGFERAASDGREYFVQVRSLVMDHDLDFSNENAVFGVRGTARMYPFGAALLWAPFMLLAHAWLHVLNLFGGAFSTDGLTNPYQRAVGLGTLIYGFAGLVLIWRLLRDYFDEPIPAIASVTIASGTFVAWYLIVENSMVHGVSLFATMLFLYLWQRGRRQAGGRESPQPPSLAWWIGLGLAGGFMAMVRWQNITFALLAGLLSLWPLRRDPRRAVRAVVACGLSGFVAFLPQLIFWKVVRGGWLAVPTADHAFAWRSSYILDVLFSSNHGLLATTPLVYIALLGLPFFVRRDRAMAFLLIAGFVCQVVINSGNEGWWGGPGFGARRFENCLLVFAVGLASLLAWFRSRPLAAPVAVLSVVVAGNLLVMADVHRGRLPPADAITFMDAMTTVASRLGNPFSFPYNAYVAWRYDGDLQLYDRLRGHTYNNIAIDFGEPDDEKFLGHGWLGPERNASRSFRWASGRTASIVVPLMSSDAYGLEFSGEAFAPPGAPRQVVGVVINRRVVASVPLRRGHDVYLVEVPAGVLRPNLNLIQFQFAYSMAPSEAGVSADSRSLAVLFDTLKLRRHLNYVP